MLSSIKNHLLNLAEKKMVKNDPSHDFLHAKRVLMLAEAIHKKEGGDLDVLIPAALFHDAVIYPKNDPRSKLAPEESAEFIAGELENISQYSKEKIEIKEEKGIFSSIKKLLECCKE